jgi:hypothetical protein
MSISPTQSIPVPEPGLTREEMVQRARDMVGVLRERQEEAERIGRLPDETSREFVEAGFYRILQPRRFGGYEFDLPTFTRVAIALARGCPASGWTYTLTAGHAHMLAALWPEEGQIDIYGADGEVRMPGRFRPGTATPVDGGYSVSGTWDYVSGCDSATHLAFGFMLGDDPSAGELATDFIGVVDYADCEIIDNWDVLGLRGTGSKRVVVEDVFVPSDYDYMDWSRRAAAGEIEYGRELDHRLQLRKQYCAKLAYDAVNLMMRTNGSAGMRGGAMWQRLPARPHGAHDPQHRAARARRRQLRAHAPRPAAPRRRGGLGPGSTGGALSATLADPMTHISAVMAIGRRARG